MILNGISSANVSNRVTRNEIKFNDKVFRDCQKNVKTSEVRDADWGLYAAQTCLAKDLTTASEEETKLIMSKMDYLQNIINANMNQDQRIWREDEEDKRSLIETKANAQATTLPAKSDLIKTTSDSAEKVIKSSAELVKEVKPGILSAPGKILDLAA